jgi:mono/diheme cytochrome c family protein
MNSSKILIGTAAAAALLLTLAPAAGFAADLEAGKAAYTANCASCHGDSGKGDGPVGAVLQPPPRDFTTGDFKLDADSDGTPGTDADLKEVISKGAAAFGGNQMMAPWGGVLSDADIDNVIAYVRSLKP